MPLTQLFTVVQDAGDKSIITIADVSTGTDSSLTSRRVYLRKHDGTYLVQSGTTTSYEIWPYMNSSIELSVLDKDYGLDVRVDWLSNSTVVYTSSMVVLFKDYAEAFRYQLTQFQSDNPRMLNNPNFYENKMKLKVCIDSAEQAAVQYSDVLSAQFAMNEAKKFIDNPTYFY